MPRRSLLLVNSSLAAVVLGGACSYTEPATSAAAKSAQATSKPSTPANDAIELPPSGDIELDHWRRLAVKAPFDELFEHAMRFLAARVADYPKDEILWRGVARLANEAADNPARPFGEGCVLVLIAQIGGIARPAEPSLRELLPRLKARRELLRQWR